VRSRTFRDLRSAPRDGSAVEFKHGPAREVVLARWSGQTKAWVKVGDPQRQALDRVTSWRPAPVK
jgi:aminoglycoside phosphotransferase (APT) family kinase protein